jgi:hypothetical protein
MTKAGRLTVVKVSGTAVAMTGEATTTTDNTVYQITNTAKRVLDRDATITVKDGGVATAETYTLDRLGGTITFTSADPGRVITVDGDYLPMSTAAYAHAHTYRKGVDLHLIPAYGATHKKRLPGLKFASGTLSQWDVTSDYFSDALTAGEPIVLEFRAEAAGEPKRVWALLESDEMRSAIASPQDEIVTFISTDELLNL